MSSSPGIQLAVVLGPEPQKPVWRPSGINLFVELELHAADSPEASAHWGDSDARVPPLVQSREPTKKLESTIVGNQFERDHRKGPSESELGTGVFEDDYSLPLVVQLEEFPCVLEEETWGESRENNGLLRRWSREKETHAPEIVTWKCEGGFDRCLVVELGECPAPALKEDREGEHYVDLVKDDPNNFHTFVSEGRLQDLEDDLGSSVVPQRGQSPCPAETEKICQLTEGGLASKEQFGRNKHLHPSDCGSISSAVQLGEPPCPEELSDYWNETEDRLSADDACICSQNRSWSPELDDYSFMKADMNFHHKLIREDATRGDPRDESQQTLSGTSESEVGLVVGELGCTRLPISIDTSSPVIESFHAVEMSAAFHLLEMRYCKSTNELSEREEVQGLESGTSSLGFRGVCELEGPSTMAQKVYAAFAGLDSRNVDSDIEKMRTLFSSGNGSSGIAASDAWTFGIRRNKCDKRPRDLRRLAVDEDTDLDPVERSRKKRHYEPRKAILEVHV